MSTEQRAGTSDTGIPGYVRGHKVRTGTHIANRHTYGSVEVDRDALTRQLRRAMSGDVRFDTQARAMYATDSSNYRHVPIGVVMPDSIADVQAALAVCRDFSVPVLSRGGGTSLAGQCCNEAVVFDMSRHLHTGIEIDADRRLARVQPGVVLDDLRAAAERHGLTFGPDPSTHSRCTLGGMIGNDSCGVHSIMAGRTSHNVEELDILLYDGTRMTVGAIDESQLAARSAGTTREAGIIRDLIVLRDANADLIRERFPHIPRRVSGYSLNQLLPEHGFHVARSLVGTEGTCMMLLGATLRLVPSPSCRAIAVLGYDDVVDAADHVPNIRDAEGLVGLEAMDERLVRDEKFYGLVPEARKALPPGGGWLFAEVGADSRDEARALAEKIAHSATRGKGAPSARVFDDPDEQALVWQAREAGLGATARMRTGEDAWEGWEDSAVAPDRLGSYLRELRALMNKYHLDGPFYGHFGDGCVHTRINFDLMTRRGIDQHFRFVRDAAELVVAHGGSLSGEHGDGQSRGELLPIMFGERLVSAFERFKDIWDPDGKMNPGKVVRPRGVDDDLRIGVSFNPKKTTTHFAFLKDMGSFARASMRCVGVGQCRSHDEASTMCPSYRATRREEHSTRGRAHLLFEMLTGDVIKDGFRSDEVREALDMCLACKACKSECPTHVDMATWKAEFYSQYYQGRLRPRNAYAMGLIDLWARGASLAPGMVNAVTSAPVLGSIAKFAAGVHPRRTMPQFAHHTFRQLRERVPGATWANDAAGRARLRDDAVHQPETASTTVLLWADTFNNNFFPDVLDAAIDVLQHAGFTTIVARKKLCCGRPLYDFGMLDRATRLLHDILDELRPLIRAGVPVVGLEPSCVAVFRDELLGLLPNDEDAQRLSRQTFLLSEFLQSRVPDLTFPKLERRALVHGHCHHESVLDFDAERWLLDRIGVDYDVLQSGCCGMAGSFGFERSRYDVSMQIGEDRLLPAVRGASSDTLLVTDGFSCREQIEQGGGRRTMHVTQLARMALHGAFPREPAETT